MLYYTESLYRILVSFMSMLVTVLIFLLSGLEINAVPLSLGNPVSREGV